MLGHGEHHRKTVVRQLGYACVRGVPYPGRAPGTPSRYVHGARVHCVKPKRLPYVLATTPMRQRPGLT